MKHSERIVSHGDVSLSTEHFGKRGQPAVLLLAGATVSMLFWDEEFCRLLADKGFFVIRYDNRDVGRSTTYEPGTAPYDLLDLLDDAIAILDDYHLEKAHLVGMSLGGLIAQMAALKYPRRVESLTLIATGPWGDPDPGIPEMDTRILDFQAKSATVDWTNEDTVVDYLLEGAALMSGQKPLDRARTERTIRQEFRRANRYISMFNHAALQGGEAYYNRLNEIRQPTLIMHGTDDLIWHYRNSDTLLKGIKGSKRMTLAGTGHELHPQDWPAIVKGIANLAGC